MKSIFILEDYINFNKDLNFNNKIEYITHWENIGYKQRRLCNKELLYVKNEFGIEILFNIGYYYYLYKNNLLFDNKISTYIGMEAYYYFIPKEQLILRNEKRVFTVLDKYKLTIYLNIKNNQLNLNYWIPPTYKEYYQNDYFKFDKEILIINNKFNSEWNSGPKNFIDIHTLESILNLLKDKYQIIYIKPTYELDSNLQFSFDSNEILKYNDIDMTRKCFSKDVIIFDDLFKDDRYKHMNYNLLKCYLFSSCDKYISVQGGANNLISYFAKNIIIYHKEGPEIEKNIYSYRSGLQCPNNNLIIKYTDSYSIFIDFIKSIYLT